MATPEIIQQLSSLFGELSTKIGLNDTAGAEQTEAEITAVLQDADVTDEDVQEALQKVTPVEAHDEVADGYDSLPEHTPESQLDYIKGLIDNNQIANNVDQSSHVDAYEVHGDVVSDNDSNVANATGVGSIAGEEVYGNQVQTGDGQQVGGDSGVQNQGDNSGQQAGYDAHADNITTGDSNTVGSDYASGVGQGQISLDHVDANDSALAFGDGYSTNQADDLSDSHDSFTATATATDSGNSYTSDDDSQTQTVDIHGEGYEEYAPTFEHDDYEGGDYHEDGPDHHGIEVEQEQTLVEDSLLES